MVLDKFMYVFAKWSQALMFFFVSFNCVIKFEISSIALFSSVQLHNVTENGSYSSLCAGLNLHCFSIPWLIPWLGLSIWFIQYVYLILLISNDINFFMR